MSAVVETEAWRIVDIRILRPVKWSAIDKKTGTYRDGFVKTFLEFEGRPLLDEDGEPLLDGRGSQRSVTASSFAQRYGIARSTFNLWVQERRGYSPHPNSRDRTVPTISTVEPEPAAEGSPFPPEVDAKFRAAVEHNEAIFRNAAPLTDFAEYLTGLHAEDLSEVQWAALDTIRNRIARLYTEAEDEP